MKAVITGPRSGLNSDFKMSFLHLEIDYEELPKVGEHIVLNSGSDYVVERVMWWVQGEENDAYWSRTENYEVAAEHEVVYVCVRPADMYAHDLYREGLKAGRREAAAELLELLKLTANAPDSAVPAIVRAWAEREGKETAEETARNAAMEKLVTELGEKGK
jgi:hypothetical protein